MLWATAAESGFTSPYWMTFKQAMDMKAHVRKGEKGTQIVYADKFEREELKADGSKEIQKIPFLKQYTVFNACQIEGLSEAFNKKPESINATEEQRNEKLEQFFSNTEAKIYTGTRAAYHPTTDRIEMPPFEAFNKAAGYYSTLAHELGHWTGHPSRLARDFGCKKHGDEGYAKEELVAELNSCFIGADLGIEPISEEQHSAYIQSWLKVLKSDKRFIFQAASHAQKAVEYVGNLQKKNVNCDEVSTAALSPP
jgi:antirestriction protein ArdC